MRPVGLRRERIDDERGESRGRDEGRRHERHPGRPTPLEQPALERPHERSTGDEEEDSGQVEPLRDLGAVGRFGRRGHARAIVEQDVAHRLRERLARVEDTDRPRASHRASRRLPATAFPRRHLPFTSMS